MAHAWELLLLLALAVLARPAAAQPSTCAGAVEKFLEGQQACPGDPPSPSTCGNQVCAAAISSLDDAMMSSMRTGFTACGQLPEDDPHRSYGEYAEGWNIYMMVHKLINDCGLPASTMKLTPPALDTCDGAVIKFLEGQQACPGDPPSPSTCGNNVCAAAISSLDDAALSKMKTGFTACGLLPEGDGRKNMTSLATYLGYYVMYSLSADCGLPASTVKLTLPSPDTCDGALARHVVLDKTCGGTAEQSPSTCGNLECAAAISSIDDATLSKMKTGFTACGQLPDGDVRKSFAPYATYYDYVLMISKSTDCGLPASTVKLTLPSPDTCDGALARYKFVTGSCPGSTPSPSTCCNAVCAAAISSIDDTILSQMKTGFTACGALPDDDNTGRKYYTFMNMTVNYRMINGLAMQCGLPANKVKLTPLALDTCDGAYWRFQDIDQACPYNPSSLTRSPSTCGNATCASVISSIDDAALSKMKTGFMACSQLPDDDFRKERGGLIIDESFVSNLATECCVPRPSCNTTNCNNIYPCTGLPIVRQPTCWIEPVTAAPPPPPPPPPSPPSPAPPTNILPPTTTATHVVKMALSLPMSKASFTTDKQDLFRGSIATVAGVSIADVTIDKIETISGRRRQLAESIRVDTSIKSSSEAGAKNLAQALTADKMNAELSKAGLPKAAVLEAPKVAKVSDMSATRHTMGLTLGLACLSLCLAAHV